MTLSNTFAKDGAKERCVMASEQEVRVSMHLIMIFFIAALLWRNEEMNNFNDEENHLCRIGDRQNNHHRRVLGLIIKPSWFPLHRLMKLKYLDEDTSSLIMEYMDTDSTSTQKPCDQRTPDDRFEAEHRLRNTATLTDRHNRAAELQSPSLL
ncbi:hypothetical protein Q8A67_016472 [Cirrhinus molitorella]|uniref:Uncharacterized protein n=1 Tax=Cirrhinus molitorella TaxID=172907 RepID=A0AA88PCY9_9TELE|nr:hypothetical protein Q8A67_016472 [Cirrhinus molitorella]